MNHRVRLREEAEKLLDGITPGEWQVGVAGHCNVVSFDGDDVHGVTCTIGRHGNAAFIAAAPRLIRELLALTALIDAPSPQKEPPIDNGNIFVFCDVVTNVGGCVRGAGHNGPHAFVLPPYPQQPVLLKLVAEAGVRVALADNHRRHTPHGTGCPTEIALGAEGSAEGAADPPAPPQGDSK